MEDSIKSSSENLSTVINTQLPERVNQNIEMIITLHKRHEQEVSRNQRTVENATKFFGSLTFLYVILLAITLWVTCNILPRRLHFPRFDPPPFSSLEFLLTISSFVMTTGILIKQNREEKLAQQRERLNLQINLLSEQKIAKIIALVEELRQDLPNVKNRYDAEAEMMKEFTDPHAVTIALEETLTQELEAVEKNVDFQ